jgi:8-oxo-dGTP pyrophosphatase MutT (NUDIX family)
VPHRLTTCDGVRARLELLRTRASTPLPAESVPGHFRRAAVLLLVGCHDGSPTLVLTERSSRMRAHAGEIALPGGRIEPGETPEQGAVREATEEVGVVPSSVEILGRLDEAWSKARNHVVPVVGWYDADLTRLFPASEEVARVFLVALDEIADRSRHRIEVAVLDGVTYENDVVDTDACRIYGLTADLVLDLVAWLEGLERGRIPIRLAELQRSLGST